jgi:hypothetical protein
MNIKTTNYRLSLLFIFSVFSFISCNGISNKVKEPEDIEAVVSSFYASLELSPELNQKHYQEGGVIFDLNKFNEFINDSSLYSKERIANLTGDYHDRFNIALLTIDSIKSDANIIEVIATVEYTIYELGKFVNEEKLIFNVNQGSIILNKWEDVQVKNMEIPNGNNRRIFKEVDFYKTLGSTNR